MSDPVDLALQELRREYLASLPARLDELRSGAAGFRAGTPGAAAGLRTKLHRLAGSGGSYGFSDLSNAARQAEQWLATNPSPADASQLERLLERVAVAVGEAGTRLNA
jgi:HPt (histidine-containing phosphotransfer) domain-containing protein